MTADDDFPPTPDEPSNADIVRLMRYMHRENMSRFRAKSERIGALEGWRDGDRMKGVPGAATRLDRVEQTQESQKWVIRAATVAGFGGFVAAVGALMAKVWGR